MANGGINLHEGDLFAGRYQVARQLSIGGMGAVYEVVHLETKRRRALKVMRPELLADESARARFKLEAQVAATIESEHIVEVVDAGVEGGVPFIVMELLRGEDLGAVVARRGRLPPTEVVELCAQAARALERTHAAGIIHRDLKPENLFLTAREDGSPRVKVLDFGIAKVVEDNRHASRATASIGTPVFMAPEQISGARLGPPADTYALGHIAYNLLCGAAYWDTEASANNLYSLLLKIPVGPPEAASTRAGRSGATLPPGFDAWFAKAVAPAPEARFQSAAELVTALAGVLGVAAPLIPRPVDLGVTAVPERLSGSVEASSATQFGATMPLPPGLRPHKTRALWIAGAVAFLAIGGAVAVLAGGDGGGPESASGVAAAATATGRDDAPPAPQASASSVTTALPDPAMTASTGPKTPPPRVEPAPRGALPPGPTTTASANATTKPVATPRTPSPPPTNPLLTR